MDGNHRGAGKRRSFLRIRNSCGEILANHEVIALTENNHEVIDNVLRGTGWWDRVVYKPC